MRLCLGNFERATVVGAGESYEGINAVLKKLEQPKKQLDKVAIDRETSKLGRRVPLLCFKELALVMEADHKPQWVC